MKRYLLIAALMSSLATPAFAGLNEGVAAATTGDYARAFTEFEPLAAAGDPVAQYYLAKLYLEGRGPADGVPRGVELMTKAANGGHPEAQAQLGLMYAMGLGVTVDNVKAHELLTKAITALPDGMRRTVAEANRDAVLQRMTPDQRNALASRTIPAATTIEPVAASEPAPAAAPKATTEVAAVKPKPTAPETPKPTVTETKTKTETKQPETTQVAAAEPKPAVTEKPAAKAEVKQPETPVVKAETKPAEVKPVEAPAKETATAETKPVETKPAETKPTTTQTASATPATPATEEQVKAAVRIQIASLPTEEGAWAGWKELSAKHADQLGGLTPIVESADLGELGTRYRIQVGPFQTIAAATERCDVMKKAGLDCLVVGKQ